MDTVEIAIAVVQRDDDFLVGVRSADSALAGKAEFPGGKIELGESPAAAAARECLEESGIAVKVGNLLSTVDHQYDHARVRLYFYACTPIDSRAAPRPPFRWTPRSELSTLNFPAANAAIVTQLALS